jgi:hypothetical protein
MTIHSRRNRPLTSGRGDERLREEQKEMTKATEPGEDGRRLPAGLLALGFVLFAVAGILAGLLEVTLIPLRYGTTLVPLAPVLTVLTGVLLPAIARGLTDSTVAAVPPAVGQLVTIWLLATGRPEGDVLMPAGGTAWVSYSVLILGTLVPLSMLGFASRPGPWHWPLGRRPAIAPEPAHLAAPGRRAAAGARLSRRRARSGSDSDGAR